jgi:hypothetical protein
MKRHEERNGFDGRVHFVFFVNRKVGLVRPFFFSSGKPFSSFFSFCGRTCRSSSRGAQLKKNFFLKHSSLDKVSLFYPGYPHSETLEVYRFQITFQSFLDSIGAMFTARGLTIVYIP